MSTDLDERVRALERALTERDDPPAPVPEVADVSSDVAELESRVTSLEATVADLDARQQAVEAYVERMDHVDETIERRADAALAAVDRLESSLREEPHASGAQASVATSASASDATPKTSVVQSAQSTTQPGPAHVTDASSTTDDSDERDGSAPNGFLARILGL